MTIGVNGCVIEHFGTRKDEPTSECSHSSTNHSFWPWEFLLWYYWFRRERNSLVQPRAEKHGNWQHNICKMSKNNNEEQLKRCVYPKSDCLCYCVYYCFTCKAQYQLFFKKGWWIFVLLKKRLLLYKMFCC